MITTEILEAINNKDIKTLKKFKKELDSLDFKTTKIDLKKLVNFLIIEANKVQDDKLKIAISSLIVWRITFRVADKLKQEYEQFIFKNIVHKNGNIRQPAVKMGSIFIKILIDEKDKSTKDFIVSFMNKLLQLIDKYRTLNAEEIEKVKPCQYKSLMLLLEELSYPNILKIISSFDDKRVNNNLKKNVEKKLDDFYYLYDEYFFDPDDAYSRPEKKEDYYYDAMEFLNGGEWQTALKILHEGILYYDDYIELYVGLAASYRFNGDKYNFKKYVELGFKKLKEKFPTWPEELSWGYIDNRQFLRMINFQASLYFEEGKKNKAEALYKLLLKLNPEDNQGIRYYLAGLYEGISSFKLDEMFDKSNNNRDRNEIENLFDKQNKKHNFFTLAEDDDYLDEEESDDYEEKNNSIQENDKDGFVWTIT